MGKPRLGRLERAAKRAFYENRELTILKNKEEIRNLISLEQRLGRRLARMLSGNRTSGKHPLDYDNLILHAVVPNDPDSGLIQHTDWAWKPEPVKERKERSAVTITPSGKLVKKRVAKVRCQSFVRGTGFGPKISYEPPNGSKRFQKREQQASLASQASKQNARDKAFEGQLRTGRAIREAVDLWDED